MGRKSRPILGAFAGFVVGEWLFSTPFGMGDSSFETYICIAVGALLGFTFEPAIRLRDDVLPARPASASLAWRCGVAVRGVLSYIRN